jgi:hypothetical protein
MAEQYRKLLFFTHQSAAFRFKTAITSSLSLSFTFPLFRLPLWSSFTPTHPQKPFPSRHAHLRYVQKE